MSYYMICQNCGKGTIGRYATDNSLCGECSDNSSTTDKISVEKLQKQLNIALEALKYILKQPVSDEIISFEEYPSHIRWRANEALEDIGAIE